MIPIFYHADMVADSGGYSPSPAKAVYFTSACEMLPGVQVLASDRAHVGTIALAHDVQYVRRVLDCAEPNGFGNTSIDIAHALPYQVGSLIDACRFVLRPFARSRVACSPTSGFHHARYNSGHGFCTFNGLVIAALACIAEGLATKVGILDLDFHEGDGTQQIIKHMGIGDKVKHWSSGFTFTGPAGADLLLDSLPGRVKGFAGCDLLIYQAGADQHIDDPLGGIFTDEQMARRDRRVFQAAAQYGIPLVWNLAGGYRRTPDGAINPVIDTHVETMRQCIMVYEGASREQVCGER